MMHASTHARHLLSLPLACIFLLSAGLVAPSMAAPLPLPVNIDSRAATAPGLEVYRAGRHVFRVTFKDGGTASDIGGHTPFMSWSTSAAAVVTSTSAWTVIGASSGLVDFTFSTSALNHASGRYIYEVGVVSNGQPSVYRQGTFIIRGSPFASGANQVLWASNVVWGTFNAINWPFLLPADTNGWDVSGDGGGTFTNWLAVSGGNLTLAGTGRSGSNTIGLTTAAIQGAATGAVHGSYLHVNKTGVWVIASITNALNTSIVALNAASNTFEADINALVAVSNAPTLQAVGETSATATGSRYTNGLRLVEFASDAANDYAARFENTHTAGDHTVVKIGAGTLNAAIWASNQTAGVVAKIATDAGDGLIIESTLGKGELLSSTAPLYIESPSASMFIRGAHGGNSIALDVGRLGNTNRVKLGGASYALDTTQGNSRIAHVLELNEVTFIGSPAHAFSLKPADTPADGAVMTYDSAKDTWTNRFTINQSSKSDGDVLVYRSAQGQYTNEAQSGGLPASATNVMVTFAMTNGWDVSAGGGGGIPQWLTNYQFEATYNSNEWMTQSSDVTNVLQFETETYDLGNIYNPATFAATVIKDGRYEAYVYWGMGHSLAASKQMHTFFQTNGFAVGATFRLEGSQVNSQLVKGQSYRRVLKLTSNSTVRACNYFTASGTRLGGGDGDNSNELRHHMSMFSLEYLGP